MDPESLLLEMGVLYGNGATWACLLLDRPEADGWTAFRVAFRLTWHLTVTVTLLPHTYHRLTKAGPERDLT